jgi:hypothetical protein
MVNPKKWEAVDIVDMIFQRDPTKYDQAVKLMDKRDRKGLIKLFKTTTGGALT